MTDVEDSRVTNGSTSVETALRTYGTRTCKKLSSNPNQECRGRSSAPLQVSLMWLRNIRRKPEEHAAAETEDNKGDISG